MIAFESAIQLAARRTKKSVLETTEPPSSRSKSTMTRLTLSCAPSRTPGPPPMQQMPLWHEVNLSALHGLREHQRILRHQGLINDWGIEAFRAIFASADGLLCNVSNPRGRIFRENQRACDLADFQSYNPIYGTTESMGHRAHSGAFRQRAATGFTALEAGSDIGGSTETHHTSAVSTVQTRHTALCQCGHELPTNPRLISPYAAASSSADDLKLALSIMPGPAERVLGLVA